MTTGATSLTSFICLANWVFVNIAEPFVLTPGKCKEREGKFDDAPLSRNPFL